MNNYFEKGTARVGDKEIPFEKQPVRGNFLMYIPQSFVEDKSIVSNYTYLFSKDKSPLSIAVKFVSAATDKQKIIDNYFNGPIEVKLSRDVTEEEGVTYRETVTSSQYLSVYSLRFSIDTEDGLLLGCFNCDAAYKDDWKPTVLQMMQNVEKEG